ncbi:MAG TPA: hypothetical protein VN372_10975 [Methanospirillum sp.]|nr:hypothetical protein [Methanospirillum sp.]
MLADISDRKRAEEALKRANHKPNLLSSITCHEFGNQLQVLFGYLEFVQLADLDPEGKGFVEKADSAAHNIHRQIAFTKDYEEIGIHSPDWQDVRGIISSATKAIDISPIQIRVEISGVDFFADPLME